MRDGDEWKAAFCTNRGLFEPLVMFFGLMNSPATFQTMMNNILAELIRDGTVCIYMDNILIFSQSRNGLQQATQQVLDILRCHKLHLKAEKCEFNRKQIKYLGLVISYDRAAMDTVKVSAVVDWPQPRNRKEVQSFLGFTNFYHHFIEGFSNTARPLFELTKNDTPFAWTTDCEVAFQQLRADHICTHSCPPE